MNSLKALMLTLMIVMEVTARPDSRVTTRGELKSPYGQAVPQQQPLVFGRRGLDPTMNSLFFGKRSSPSSQTLPSPSLDDVRTACTILISYIDEVERLISDEV